MFRLSSNLHQCKICYITAIYGNYESTCKPFAHQTIPSDFICFTDNPTIVNNGWTIDTHPYHVSNKSKIDDDTYTNSIANNQHTFNIAKYYKQQFHNIPKLQAYDVVVWLDGTIRITNPKTSEWINSKMENHKIIGWMHEFRSGKLESEVKASDFPRYTSTCWNNQRQPFQDVFQQFDAYIRDGYNDRVFDGSHAINDFNRDNFGVWLTCFAAFANKDPDVVRFLDMWYLQTLQHTTQDQISFPYVCYKTGIVPYTLPDGEIRGKSPHASTDFYDKLNHGL